MSKDFLVRNDLNGASVDLVVGIPSYNEADNIAFVVEQAAKGLKKYYRKLNTAIVNADNFSDDGTAENFDTLIAATGYLVDLPFLSPEIVPLKGNRLDLYKRMVQPGWPGLYLMGFFNTDTSLNMVYEYQARWIRDIELGEACLPSKAEMEADVAAMNHWVEKNYKESPRHTIEEEHVPYIGGLKKSLKRMRCAAKRRI